MIIDPELAEIVARQEAAGGPPAHEVPIAQMRLASDATNDELGGPPEEVAEVRDMIIAGPAADIPVRVYRPAAGEPLLPAVVWFHGGGWVVGSIAGFDSVLRALANRSGAIVVSVGYRLAPEDPFPAGVEDAVAVTRWMLEHAQEIGADPGRIAVGGDSAGGNLATVAARRLRDADGHRPRLQVLVYPVCDGACSTPSYRDCEDGFGLSAASMRRFFDLYLDGHSSLDPDVSPLRAEDLSGLPPAWILTAELDPLRDEAEAYAQALRDAGVPVTLARYEGAVHGFFRWLAASRLARRAVAEAGEALRRGLQPAA